MDIVVKSCKKTKFLPIFIFLGLMNDRDEMNIPETKYSASQIVQDTHDALVFAKVGLGYT